MKAAVWFVAGALLSTFSCRDFGETDGSAPGAAGAGAAPAEGGAQTGQGAEGGKGGDKGGSAAGDGASAGAAEGGLPSCAGTDCGGGGAGAPGGGEAGAVSDPDQGPISGTVVWYGAVAAVGATIVLNGDASTTTDEQGHFSFPDPGPSYELALIAPPRVLVLQGLHGRAPKIRGFASAATKMGRFNGNVFGVPVESKTDDMYASILVGDADIWDNQAWPWNASHFNFGLDVSWMGDDSVSGRMIIYNSRNGHPHAYVERPVTLSTKPDQPVVDFELLAVDEREVPVNVTVPEHSDYFLETLVGPFTIQCSWVDKCTVPDTPLVKPGIRYIGIDADTGFTSSARNAPAAGTLELVLPSISTPVFPAEGAIEVDESTEFSWSTPADGMLSVIDFTVPTYEVRVVTTETHAKLPDLSKFGVNYSPKSAGSWRVISLGPVEGVDNALGLLGYTVDLTGATGSPLRLDYTESDRRTFTTAP